MTEPISISKIHSLTGIDRRTINKRLSGLDFKKQGRANLYDSAEALQAVYIAAADDMNDIRTKLDLERMRKEKSIADKNEFELAIKHKEYVPTEDVNRIMGEAGEVLKSTLLGVGPTHAPALSVMVDPGEVADYVDREMRDLLGNILNKLGKVKWTGRERP